MGRKLLNDLVSFFSLDFLLNFQNEMDIPVGCELLDTITPQVTFLKPSL